MKKSTIVVLVLGIISIIVILGYSIFNSLEDAVGRKTNAYDDLTNYTNDSNNGSSSSRRISDELLGELLASVPLYRENDAYQKKSSNPTDTKEAMFFMAFKYIKNNNLYNTQNITLRNMCASKYGSSSRCILFISNENLDKYLTKYYNVTILDLGINSITFKDTSEVIERLDDNFYTLLTNEITDSVVKLTVSSKTFNYDSNIIIEENALFTREDKDGYHGFYKSSKLDDSSKISDDDVLKDSYFDKKLEELKGKYSSKAGRFEHTFVKEETNYVWNKTVVR